MNKYYDIIFRCRPGLYKTALKELQFQNIIKKATKSEVLKQRNYDLIFIKHIELKNFKDLKKLRTIDDAHIVLIYGKSSVPENKLKIASQNLKSFNIHNAKVVASIDGKIFKKFELLSWIEKNISKSKVAINKTSSNLITFFAVDEKYYLSFKIFGFEEAYLRNKTEREGALPATIAGAMAFLSNPKKGEKVLDPVCGAGTLLLELAAINKNIIIKGFDVDKRAVNIAQKNLSNYKTEISHQDVLSLKNLPTGYDILIANLPFGIQFNTEDENKVLYKKISNLLEQNESKDFRGIFITTDIDNFYSAFRNFKLEKEINTKVKGLSAKIFIIKKPK